MAAQKGRLFQIKYNTTGTTFVLVGGAREASLTINNEPVDITNNDDSGIRKLLEGAGVNSVSVTLNGVYVEDAAGTAIRTAAGTNVHKKFQVVTPGTAPITYEGEFMVASYKESGTYNGSVTYDLTLESAGAVTITSGS